MPIHRARLFVLPLLALLLVGGCADDDGKATPTIARPTGTTRATPGSSPSASAPATVSTPTSAAPTASATPPSPSAPPRAEGTVDPLGAGDVTPVVTKPDSAAPRPQPRLRDVRTGVHPELGGWDRIVFEFEGGLPGAQIAYASPPAACGSGQAVAVPGSAFLTVRFSDAVAHDEGGKPTAGGQSAPAASSAILGARQTCDFEGVVAWTVGAGGRLRFKVTQLADPPRLVIDVKQP